MPGWNGRWAGGANYVGSAGKDSPPLGLARAMGASSSDDDMAMAKGRCWEQRRSSKLERRSAALAGEGPGYGDEASERMQRRRGNWGRREERARRARQATRGQGMVVREAREVCGERRGAERVGGIF